MINLPFHKRALPSTPNYFFIGVVDGTVFLAGKIPVKPLVFLAGALATFLGYPALASFLGKF